MVDSRNRPTERQADPTIGKILYAEEVGVAADDARCAALALFALEAPSLLEGRGDPQDVLGGAFDLLERGWAGLFGPDA